MEIRALDLSDDATLAAAYGVECAATADARPGWVPLGETARVTAWRALGGWSRTLVGAFDGGELVGVASCATAADAPESAWVDVTVLPERQRAGVGSELAAAAEGVAARGVRRFVASVYRPSSDEADRLIQGFAVPLGYTVATTETVVEVDVTGGDVPSLAPRGDYSVHTYLNGVPDSLRREVGVLKGLVDAEAPSGALDWQPTPVSPEEYADELATWRLQGREVIETVAVDGQGAVVAWTCLLVAPDPARPAQIEGTLVLSQHRGTRLGAAVKSANLRTARARGVGRVRTSSEDSNEWMRALNAELGFLPVEAEALLHKQRGPA